MDRQTGPGFTDVIELREATPSDVRAIAAGLSEQDRTELLLFGCASPEAEVLASASAAEVCDVVLGDDGHPVALCGVSRLEPGRVWMLRTAALWGSRSHRRQIPSVAKNWLDRLPGPIHYNWALASNTGNLKWLRSLGFRVEAPEELGRNGALFSYFWRMR